MSKIGNMLSSFYKKVFNQEDYSKITELEEEAVKAAVKA